MAYKVEILTATEEGLARFVGDLKRVRDGRSPGRGPLVRTHTFGAAPLIQRSREGLVMLTGGAVGIAGYIGSLNREVNPNRVEEYRNAVWRGDWWFTPDPIVVTDEGDIINGQHRLLAAEEVAKSITTSETVPKKTERAPVFVVVWNVDKRAAILMDEARRSANDRRDIALRYASAAGR